MNSAEVYDLEEIILWRASQAKNKFFEGVETT